MKHLFRHELHWALAGALLSLLVAVGFARVVAAVASEPRTEAEPRLADFTPADPARGRVLYEKSCARCHGEDASGHGEDASGKDGDDDGPDLHDLRSSNARLATVIRSGIRDASPPRAVMPSFAKKYNTQDVACLVAYLRSLR